MDLSIDKAMFGMEWVFIDGKCLCSVKDAHEALNNKKWKLRNWMKQDKLKNYSYEEFVEKLTILIANYKNT